MAEYFIEMEVNDMNTNLKSKISEYNWDDGFMLPKEILDDPNCDLALALEMFYLADGYRYLENQAEATELKEWKEFIVNLYNDILNNKFSKTENSFEIPLSKVTKYKLRKQQVPEVFLTDI